MHHQVNQATVPKGRCMDSPNSMDLHRIIFQWQKQLRLLDTYNFVVVGEYKILLPDIMNGNNNANSNM